MDIILLMNYMNFVKFIMLVYLMNGQNKENMKFTSQSDIMTENYVSMAVGL